jgi:dynein light chain 1
VEEVKLNGNLPPIAKLDNGLSQMAACKKLSLSTNCIEKMITISGLRNLEILSLGRNQLKKIQGLEDVGQTLKELWISYNQIEKLEGLSQCIHLHTLFISNNKIKVWDEVGRLAQLPELRNVLFVGNPIYEDTRVDPRVQVIRRCPQIEVLDTHLVTEQTRRSAEEVKQD